MSSQIDNIARAVRRDPRRAAVLSILLITLLVLWVRYRSNAPTPAAAEQAASVQLQAAWRNAPDIGRSADLNARWAEKPLGHVSRNLFASELTVPPVNPASQPKAALRQDEDGLFWRHLERALASRADREQYRQSLSEAALKDASKLMVTSIVIGPETGAWIGEKMVRSGETVVVEGERGPFTVVSIEPARVILARDGHRVVLKLGKPGAELAEEQ